MHMLLQKSSALTSYEKRVETCKSISSACIYNIIAFTVLPSSRLCVVKCPIVLLKFCLL